MSKMCFESSIIPTSVRYMRNSKNVDTKSCDVTFLIGAKRIHANRSILSKASPYFRTMFSKSFLEAQQKEVLLQEVDAVAMNLVVDYMYSGKIEMTRSNVENLLQAAHMFHLEELLSWCCQFLTEQLDSYNCIGIGDFAATYCCEQLKNNADNYIVNNILDVMKGEEFLMCSFSYLTHILSHKALFVAPENEEKLYHGIMSWVKYDTSDRRHCLAKLLGFLRLPVLGAVFITDAIKTNDLIQNDKQCIELMKNTEDYLNTVRSRPQEVEGIFVVASNNNCSSVDNLELWPTDWRAAPRMPGKSSNIIDVVFANDRVYVTNTTSQMNTYNTTTKQWTKCSSPSLIFPDVRLVVVNGYLYAFGRNMHFNAQRYSVSTNRWRHYDTLWLHDIRTGFSVAAVDKQVYIIGGHSFQECSVTRIDRYDLTTKLCTRLDVGDQLMYPIDTGTVVYNGMIYIAGGKRCGLMRDGYSGVVRRFDPVKNLLTRVAPLSVARAHVNLVVHRAKLYAIGGASGKGVATEEVVEEYDARCDTWRVCDEVTLPMKGVGKRYVVMPWRLGEERSGKRALRSTMWRVDLSELRTKCRSTVVKVEKCVAEGKCDSDTDDSEELSDDTLYM